MKVWSCFSIHRRPGGALSRRRAGLLACVSAALLSGPSVAHAAPGNTEIRIAMSGGLNLLDPSRTSSGPDLVVMSQIYETLLVMDMKTGELKPNLAKSYRLVSPTQWEFKLRDDVKWHDGKRFTAQDVKYSLERILNPAILSPHLSQITSIKKVVVTDDYTVQIHTTTPDPVLPRRMQSLGGTGRVFIVPKHYFESKTNQQVSDLPIGTGPYKMGAWRKGTMVELVRNADYWGTLPDVAKGTYTFVPENSTRVNALLQGEVDVIERVPIADVARVQQSAAAKVVSSQDGLVHTLILDTRKPPFNDIAMRRAFVSAIDIKNIIGNLLGPYGRVLGTPMGANVAQFDKTLQPYPADRALAKKLLAAKAPIALSTFTSDGRYIADRDIYQVINAQLASVGFKVTPQTMEWGRLNAMINQRNAGPFVIVGWDFSEGDASKINSIFRPESPISLVVDPEYNRLSDLAGAEMDPAKRTAYWQQAQKLVHDKIYIAAAWQTASIYGMSKKLDWAADTGENFKLAAVKVVAKPPSPPKGG
nr:ABC transporter substrate-binding protein [uncultured Duganella sp.]